MTKLSKILALMLAIIMVFNIGVLATDTPDETEDATTTTQAVEESTTEATTEETTTEVAEESTTEAVTEESTTQAVEESTTEAVTEETTTEVTEESTTEAVTEESTTQAVEESTTAPEETTSPEEETTTEISEETTTEVAEESTTTPEEVTTTIPDVTEPDVTEPTEPDVTEPTEPDVTEPTEPEVELPAAPANITAGKFADGKVTIQWDNVDGANGYDVYLKSGENWELQGSVTKTKCSLKNIFYNSKYYVAIKAYKEIDGVKYESEMVEYTVSTGTDIPDVKVTATASSDNITVKWDALSGVSGYRVYIRKDGKWVKLTSITDTTYTYKKAIPGETYKFAVKPYAKGTEGTKFGSLKTVKIVSEDYSKATVKATDKTESTISIKWSKIKNASSYRVYIYKNGKWTYNKGITKNTYTIKGLKDATSYKIKVKPCFKVDGKVYWGAYSNTITVATAGKIVKAYRLSTLKKQVNDNVFAFKLTGSMTDGEKYYETIMKKGDKYYINIDYKLNSEDCMYIGNVKSKNVYLLSPTLKEGILYGSEYFAITHAHLLELIPFDAKNVTAKTTIFNGKRVVAEYYKNSDGLKKTYYFDGDNLIGLNLKYEDVDIDYNVKVLADPKDSYFNVPAGYKIYK